MDDRASELAELRNRVERNLADARLWTKLWSFVHHGSVFGAAVISAAAAVVLQLEAAIWGYSYTAVGTVLAAAAALVGTLAGAGGFQRKWRTNRLTRNRLHGLSIDLMSPECDPGTTRDQLKAIWRDHDRGIVGEE